MKNRIKDLPRYREFVERFITERVKAHVSKEWVTDDVIVKHMDAVYVSSRCMSYHVKLECSYGVDPYLKFPMIHFTLYMNAIWHARTGELEIWEDGMDDWDISPEDEEDEDE